MLLEGGVQERNDSSLRREVTVETGGRVDLGLQKQMPRWDTLGKDFFFEIFIGI